MPRTTMPSIQSLMSLANVEVRTLNDRSIPVVTSLQIATSFDKTHDNVLKDIRNVLESDDFSAVNFYAVEYTDSKGEKRPMYLLTRDGFFLVALAYTGYKARVLRKAYIIRFSEMEKELQNRASGMPALPKDYPAALRALADADERRLRIAQKLAVEQPKARVYDVTFADRQLTLAKFCRRLRGVNTNSTKQDMERAGILYRQGGTYRLYAKYRDTHFAEKTDGNGKLTLIVLDKGKQLLTKLYLGGELTMKKGYDRPLKVIGA